MTTGIPLYGYLDFELLYPVFSLYWNTFYTGIPSILEYLLYCDTFYTVIPSIL